MKNVEVDEKQYRENMMLYLSKMMSDIYSMSIKLEETTNIQRDVFIEIKRIADTLCDNKFLKKKK